MRLALANAFDLVGMQAVNLAAALALLLLHDGLRLIERPEEDRPELLVTINLVLDVADGPPQIGLELAQRLARPLELFGMGVTLMLDQGEFADPNIGLPQFQSGLPCQAHQPFPTPMDEFGIGRKHHILRLNSRVHNHQPRIAGLHRAGLDRHRQALLL